MNLQTRDIDLTNFESLKTQELYYLHSLFKKYNYELRIAGGAVRDILLGKEPADIDFATDATPEQMVEMFNAENVRILNKNGFLHGTVTARINLKENFEITTLRIDTNHDGRRADVLFTTDWAVDAARRDLTINAMFLKVNFQDRETSRYTGLLIDYFNGQNDLSGRLIRFVGEPADRIREDFLRILRYFRFHGRLSTPDNRDYHEKHTLDAIIDNAEGLSKISGERLWVELRRILICQSSYYLINRMNECGILPFLGFPSKLDSAPLERYKSAILSEIILSDPTPATMLAHLLHDESEIENLHQRLKLSNIDFNIITYLVKNRSELTIIFKEENYDTVFKYCKDFYILSQEPKKTRVLIEEAIKMFSRSSEFRNYVLERWATWEVPKFPLKGENVIAAFQISGRALSPVILELKRFWLNSDFKMTAEELLSEEVRLDLIKRNIIRLQSSFVSE